MRTPQKRSMFRALRHRSFQLFFAGQLVSLVGTWMQAVAQSWLVYRLTGSTLSLGLVGFCAQFPVFVLAPVGGVIADRFPRRKVLMGTQAAAMTLASILAALTLSGWVKEWHLFVLATMLGTVNAIDIPTRQTFVVEMVGKDDLLNAIALNSSMVNGARMIGPAVAGVLVGLVGEGWCFLLNAVSYIAVLTGLAAMKLPRVTVMSRARGLRAILEGFTFVARTAPIRALLLLLGAVSLLGSPYAVLLPVFANEILHTGPAGLGWMTGAAGLGAMLAALTLARRRVLFGLGRWVALACCGFGGSLILFANSESLVLSVLLLLPTGFCMMLQMASSNTLIQAMVPDIFRGRVMAVYSMMFMGMAPVGALLAGSLSAHLGAPFTVTLCGSLCVLGSVLFALGLRRIIPEGRRLVIAQQAEAGHPPDEVTGGMAYKAA